MNHWRPVPRRRAKRRFNGFQTPGLRGIGDCLVTDRNNKQAELNEVVAPWAFVAAFVSAIAGGVMFGSFGVFGGAIFGYFWGIAMLKEDGFLRG